MQSRQVDGPPDPRVGSVESRVRKIDWLWEQILIKQREIRLLENEIGRTDSNEYLDDPAGVAPATER